ncbi:MAG: hydroxymethylbilane synthase [Alphaproteobacteria bacterium]|nr:hydroxymethylbilane synthase [Alphaproteobacteria bacterium]MDE2629969.1 hydroxymethylbilane synthase [Alphaproteobacteria bacterium]
MPQSSSSLRLGTRGSKLARTQAGMVAGALEERGIACEIVPVKTTGDRILDRSLADAGGKGLFTKELEEALLSGAIDLAVHSMKDVPTALPGGLAIAVILPREDPSDAFIAKRARALSELPAGARVGTSSVRRRAQLLRVRPDLECLPLRGNVDTRLAKLEAGEMDAILLAMAGLKRLGLAGHVTSILNPEEWLPSLAQGAVGIEIRQSDTKTASLIAALNDEAAATELACERAFQAALDGSCRTPIAGLARLDGRRLCFRGEVIAPDGRDFAATSFRIELGGDPKQDAARAGRDAGIALRPRAVRWLSE